MMDWNRIQSLRNHGVKDWPPSHARKSTGTVPKVAASHLHIAHPRTRLSWCLGGGGGLIYVRSNVGVINRFEFCTGAFRYRERIAVGDRRPMIYTDNWKNANRQKMALGTCHYVVVRRWGYWELGGVYDIWMRCMLQNCIIRVIWMGEVRFFVRWF